MSINLIHPICSVCMKRKGKCLKCGKCCEAITIFTSKKLLKLVWLRKLLISFSLKHYYYIGLDEDGDMIFECMYFKDKKCKKYKMRPLTCSQYPTEETFTRNLLIDGCGFYFEDK